MGNLQVSMIAKKRHQKQLKRNAKKKAVRRNRYELNLRKKLQKQQQKLVQMELGTLLEKMLNEIDPENYEEWVEKLDLRPELRTQLDAIVAEERERTQNEKEKENES